MGNWSYTDWYKANKESFNAKRRARYEQDPEYRKRVLEMNRDNREKQRAEQSKEDKARKKATKVVALQSWKEFDGSLPGADGETQKFLTIGAVAKAVRRSTQSIRLWEKQGIIPATEYRNARGDRLYTPQMVMEIMLKVKEEKSLEPVDHKSEIVPINAQVKLADGTEKTLCLFRVGVLAQSVGRTVLTLEQMERKNVFPQTPFRDPKTSHRYYTAEMIESVKQALDEMGGARLRGDKRKAEFNARITEEWTKQGVIGATMLSSAPTEG